MSEEEKEKQEEKKEESQTTHFLQPDDCFIDVKWTYNPPKAENE